MKNISIGRNPSNDVVINDMSVSSTHANLTVSDDGVVSIRDLGSTNGTYVDGHRISGTTIVNSNSRIKLGYADFNWHQFVDPKLLKKPSKGATVLMNSQKRGTELLTGSKMPPYAESESFDRNEKTIGRDASCDIRLTASDVSSKHAILSVNDNGQIAVVDCGSTNGTFVNGKRIHSRILRDGDKLMISNKYYIDWEQVFPSGIRSKKRSNGGFKVFIWILLSLITIAAAGVGGWYAYKALFGVKELEPSEIYATYKKSVVMILNSYTFDITYRDFSLSEALSILTEEEVPSDIDHCYIDQNDDVVKGVATGFGTGFFISDDGKIMTNRHVVSMLPDDIKAAEDKIKKTFYNILTDLADEEYSIFDDEYDLLYKLANEIAVKYRNVSTGIFMNDTYVSSKSDMIPCTIFDVSQSEDVDVAIIQTNNKKTPQEVTKIVDLEDIAKQEDIELGNRIYTIGFPHSIIIGDTQIGLEANNQSGEVTQNRGQYTYGHNITIERGASGSPVFDKYGKFAGIIVSGYLGISQGYNHAVQPFQASDFYHRTSFVK